LRATTRGPSPSADGIVTVERNYVGRTAPAVASSHSGIVVSTPADGLGAPATTVARV